MFGLSVMPAKPHSQGDSRAKIALVGCGAISELFYLPALARYPNVISNLILVDPQAQRTEELAAKYGVTDRRSDHTSIDPEEIDGAIIAVPDFLHHPIGVHMLSNGVPVLCEKPLAVSSALAHDMVSVAKRAGVPLAVNQTRRLFPTFREIHRLIHGGHLGQLTTIRYAEGEEFRWPTVSGFYFDNEHSNRGVLQDKGAHALDLICWWLGSKPRVVVSQNDSFGGSEAIALVKLEHRQLEIKAELWLSVLGKAQSKYRVEFERGAIEGDLHDYGGFIIEKPIGTLKRIRIKSKEKQFADFGKLLVRNFIEVVEKVARPLVAGHEVTNSIELIDEAYEVTERFSLPWYDGLGFGRNGR